MVDSVAKGAGNHGAGPGVFVIGIASPNQPSRLCVQCEGRGPVFAIGTGVYWLLDFVQGKEWIWGAWFV